jgi:hypothetical protein
MKYYLFLSLCLVCLYADAQVPNYVPTEGLVGWWPFNGNANDESGNGNDGTVNGATLTQDRFGNSNNAYSFNGTHNSIQLLQMGPTGNSSRSVSFWAKTNTLLNSQNDPQDVICYGTGTSGGVFEINLNQDCEGLVVDISDGVSTKAATTVDNVWHYYTVVYNSSLGNNLSNIVYYQDANLLATYCSQGNQTINTGLTNLPTIGSYFNHSIRFFQGQLDDIGIWNRALTQQEITDLYNGNICYDHVTVTDTLIINFNMTGFNPVTYEHSIEIYPNPTSDHITINYGDFIGLNGYTLSIFNPMGQLVHTSNITQEQEYLDLNTWGGVGVYNVVIYNPQGGIVSTKQIVLQ